MKPVKYNSVQGYDNGANDPMKQMIDITLPAKDLDVILNVLNDNKERMTPREKFTYDALVSNLEYDRDEGTFTRKLKLDGLKQEKKALDDKVELILSRLTPKQLQEFKEYEAARSNSN